MEIFELRGGGGGEWGRAMRVLALLFVFLAVPAAAAKGGKGGFAHATAQSKGSSVTATGGSHGGGSYRMRDLRKPPPLAVDRKVVEQDCTKPIDWQSGNLKCK